MDIAGLIVVEKAEVLHRKATPDLEAAKSYWLAALARKRRFVLNRIR
jgi:hypothetical protein